MKFEHRLMRRPILFGLTLLGFLFILFSFDLAKMVPEGHENAAKVVRNIVALFGIWVMGFGYMITRAEHRLTFEVPRLQRWTFAWFGIFLILTASALTKLIQTKNGITMTLARIVLTVLGLLILAFEVARAMPMGLRAYVARRLVFMVFVLFGVSVITFTLARLIPSDPAAAWLGGHPKAEQIEAMREALGLNKPLPVQYLVYMQNLFTGDWGKSIHTHQPVLNDLKVFLPRSIELVTLGLVIALIIGIPIGALSASRKDRPLDHVSRIISMSGVSIPGYFLGLLLQLVFFGAFAVLPIGGRLDTAVQYGSPIIQITGFDLIDSLLTRNWVAFKDLLRHMILPSLALAYGSLAQITRMTRSTMLDILGQDYIRTARASGLPERSVLFGDALKNAIIPTLTIVGLSYGFMLAGTFMVELVFTFPGMGLYAVRAIQGVDYPAIMGITLVVSTFYVMINLGIDLIQAFLDPRIKLQ